MTTIAANSVNLSKGKLVLLKPYLPAIKQLCQKYGVENLYVFGSLTTESFDEKTSDIDFLVKFKVNEKIAMKLLSMLIDLENLLERKIDLLRERPFVNEYFAHAVEDTKTLVYAA